VRNTGPRFPGATTSQKISCFSGRCNDRSLVAWICGYNRRRSRTDEGTRTDGRLDTSHANLAKVVVWLLSYGSRGSLNRVVMLCSEVWSMLRRQRDISYVEFGHVEQAWNAQSKLSQWTEYCLDDVLSWGMNDVMHKALLEIFGSFCQPLFIRKETLLYFQCGTLQQARRLPIFQEPVKQFPLLHSGITALYLPITLLW